MEYPRQDLVNYLVEEVRGDHTVLGPEQLLSKEQTHSIVTPTTMCMGMHQYRGELPFPMEDDRSSLSFIQCMVYIGETL